MSEVGMALSNPYRPVEGRTVGCVGVPLPGINAALAVSSEQGLKKIVTVESDMPDLQVRLCTSVVFIDLFVWKHKCVDIILYIFWNQNILIASVKLVQDNGRKDILFL